LKTGGRMRMKIEEAIEGVSLLNVTNMHIGNTTR
jgi:hypothetical protein